MAKVNPYPYQLKLIYTCVCGNVNEIDLTKYDFSVSCDSCPDCGSHGTLTIDAFCPCGKFREILVQEW